MIPFAVLNSLVSDVKMIFACKLSDDFSGFVDICGTGKCNRVGALVLENGRINPLPLQAGKSANKRLQIVTIFFLFVFLSHINIKNKNVLNDINKLRLVKQKPALYLKKCF